jgi:glycine/D-amino acid oxidase-like deaminating enzyme
MIQDTKRVLSYYRTSPDGTRILFGGRTSFRKINLRESAVRLHEMLAHVFPELNAVKLSHSWSGNVAFTFDALPHYGNKDGLHFSLGYCGQGVAMSIYLGHCLAESIVDGSKSTNAFSTIPFPSRPAYTGNPWFLPVVGEVYRLLDRFGI